MLGKSILLLEPGVQEQIPSFGINEAGGISSEPR